VIMLPTALESADVDRSALQAVAIK
jgi:hypothetical protein